MRWFIESTIEIYYSTGFDLPIHTQSIVTSQFQLVDSCNSGVFSYWFVISGLARIPIELIFTEYLTEWGKFQLNHPALLQYEEQHCTIGYKLYCYIFVSCSLIIDWLLFNMTAAAAPDSIVTILVLSHAAVGLLAASMYSMSHNSMVYYCTHMLTHCFTYYLIL